MLSCSGGLVPAEYNTGLHTSSLDRQYSCLKLSLNCLIQWTVVSHTHIRLNLGHSPMTDLNLTLDKISFLRDAIVTFIGIALSMLSTCLCLHCCFLWNPAANIDPIFTIQNARNWLKIRMIWIKALLSLKMPKLRLILLDYFIFILKLHQRK